VSADAQSPVARALRACMVCLVLVNLGFVQITEAARWSWLGPLAALTLLSPWLVRLARHLLWRLLWNLAVIGVFALLVHHVTGSGIEFLLEDGLLLAALCQVHLLNNLSRIQKPDLLFFNSFLIAVVTSYLSLDLRYSVVFLLYAPLLVVSLQLLALDRAGVGGGVRATVLSGLRRGAFVLGLTFFAFFFWPRDFQRPGLLGDTLDISPPGGLTEVAFSEQIDLDRSGRVLTSDRIVMTVRLARGVRASVPEHWRGATLDRFDGREWKPDPLARTRGSRWRRTRAGALVRGRRQAKAQVDVHLADPAAARLFAPLAAQRFELTPPARHVRVRPLPDRNLRCIRTARDRRPIRYRLELHNGWRDRGGAVPPTTRDIVPFVRLPYAVIPEAARSLSRRLRRELPQGAQQHRIVERMRGHLASSHAYLLPGADGGARNFDDFITARAGGYCEYFATALVVLLRLQRIPCRVVTGYRSAEWDEQGRVLTVRARHAHAWVEVLDPDAGWYTVDPTPPIGTGPANGGDLWSRLKAFVARTWAKVTNFNAGALDGAYAWLRTTIDRAGAFVRRRPVEIALGLAAAILLAVRLRRRRARRQPPAVREYRACLKKLGLAPAAGETPRELLARAALEPPQRVELAAATDHHERQRYAS